MESHVRYAARDLPHAPLRPAAGAGQRAFRVALLLLPIGVLGNIGYTLFGTDRAVLATVSQLPRGYLLAALALALIPWITAALRLLVWTRFLDMRIPLMDLVRMTLVVDLGSAVSPTAVGGEAFKWGLLVKHGIKPGAAASLALLPKIEDAIFFACALPVAIIITASWELPVVASGARIASDNALAVLGIGAAVMVIACLGMRLLMTGRAGARMRGGSLRWWGRSRRRLRRTWQDARAVFSLVLRRGRARLALTFGLTAVQWMARYSVISMLALFLGIPFDPVLFWLLQWVVFTIMSFVPTPGATGGAEVAFTAVYASLLPGGMIGIATAAWRFFTFYAPVALAAILFALLERRERTA